MTWSEDRMSADRPRSGRPWSRCAVAAFALLSSSVGLPAAYSQEAAPASTAFTRPLPKPAANPPLPGAGLTPPGDEPPSAIRHADGTSLVEPLKKKPGQILRTSLEEQTVSEVSLEDPIAEVRVEGNSTIATREVEKYIKTRPGRPVTPRQIKDDVDALIRTRWFATVEPYVRSTEDGPVLIFRVLEKPIVKRVEYQGNNKIKTKVFDSMTNLKAGSPYDVSANRECARRIEAHYHEKGYAFATVELLRGDTREDREVVFKIHEGPKVHVSSVKFEGNKHFSDGILGTKKRTKTQILWLFGGKYDPATIPDDMAAIRQYYQGLGYFDVEIEHKVDFSKDKSGATITYSIDEGVCYKIRNIDLFGQAIFSEEQLRADIKTKSGDDYNARLLAADVEKIRARYGELGRLFATVDMVPQFLEEPGFVDLKVQINEDKVYAVRDFRVHIQGDYPHTQTHLVRNIARIHPGDLADPKKIKMTESRLAGSQYFEGQDQRPRLEISKVEDTTWIGNYFEDAESGMSLVRGQSGEGAEPRPIPSLADQLPGRARPQPQPIRHTAAFGHAPLSTPDTTDIPRSAAPGRARVTGPSAVRPATTPIVQPLTVTRETASPAAAPRRPTSIVADPSYSVVPPLGGDEQGGAEYVDEGGNIVRGQSRDLRGPQNFQYDNSPQGDPFGNPQRYDSNLWEDMPPPEFIDIDAYLTEARTGRLMFGVGVNSDAGVVGNIVLSESNFDLWRPPTSWEDIINGTAFRGRGQKFRVEALPGTQVSRYVVDLQDPYFMDTDYSVGVSGFYYTRFFEAWNEERYGGRLRVGQQWTPEWSGSAALRLEGVELSDAPAVRPQLLTEALGSNLLSTIRLSVAHDTRDAPFLTSEGHFVEASYEQAFGEFTYPRFELEGQQYFTLYRRPDGMGKRILTLRGQAGITGDDTPIFERFYAGGFQSFRGFRFRGVSPVDTGVRVGGEFMATGTVEYMQPITANEMLQFVVFSDFGTVEEDISLDNFRLAAGGGLRITIPAMGPVPIALDWSVPIIKQDFDRTQLFSFYVGINR